MPTITLPQAGKQAGPGTVRRWRKRVGDAVSKGDVLLEVETDDGLAEIESPVAGALTRILVEAGKTVPVGSALAEIGGLTLPAASQPATKAKPITEVKPMSAKPSAPVLPILMPKAGQSMEEGTLIKWHVKVGDVIKKGQVIFEIETDKATMEVEADVEGRVARIIAAEGAVVPVQQPVAFIGESDADVEAFAGVSDEATVVASGEATKRRSGEGVAVGTNLPPETRSPTPETRIEGRVKASPAARKIAAERGVDLATVGAGSGPGGRILSTDVVNAQPSPAQKASPSALPSPASGRGGVAPAVAPAPVPTPSSGGVTRKRMSKMRKAIAGNLTLSKQTIPHFYLKGTINAEALQSFYQGEKAKYPCSLNDVVIMAVARCMMEFAPFRSRLEGDEVIEFGSANVGIAVGMDEGLVVPVLAGAEALSLKQIGSESKRLATSARAGKIEGIGKGLLTISNMGMFGVEEFSAIINPPESAILAVGAIREDILVSGGAIRPSKVMTMTLSVDHRVVDGALAAKFMARMKEILEYPQQLV